MNTMKYYLTKIQNIDPRFIQLFNNIILMFFGYLYLDFNRDLMYLFPVFAFGVLLDWLFSRIWSSQRNQRTLRDRMISVLNTIVSIVTIIKFTNNNFYIVVILVALLSKYLIVDENKNHIFNPANFGIIFALIFVNEIPIRIIYNQFAGLNMYLFYFLILNGLLITYIARRMTLAFSFLIGSFVFFYSLSSIWGFPLSFLIGPTFSFSGMLFTFFMITDPKTTPSAQFSQLIFGLFLALVSFLLRVNQYVHDVFVLLFLVTALYKFYLQFFKLKIYRLKQI